MTDQNISDKLSRERQLAIELLNKKGNRLSPGQFRTKSSNSGQNFNISELYADRTQEMQVTPSKHDNIDNEQAGCNFEPKEISGRSTDFNGAAGTEPNRYSGTNRLKQFMTPGLDEIFATSFCADVREMGRARSRLSSMGDSLPRTADIDLSPSSSVSSGDWNRRGFNKEWLADAVNAPQVDFGDEFVSGADNNALSKIIHDQHDWEKEYADIPSASPAKKEEVQELFKLPGIPTKVNKLKGKLTNHADLGDFSGYLEYADETAKAFEDSRRNFSMGEFFLKHSNDLGEICSDKSPPKRDAVPLVDTMTEHSWLKEVSTLQGSQRTTDYDEKRENKENADPNNISVSTILKAMKTLTVNDTPHTVLQKFSAAKLSKSGQTPLKPPEHADILSSTIKSTEGAQNPLETESVTTLNDTDPKSPANVRMPVAPSKETFSIEIHDDSGKGRTLSSQNIIDQPTTPRNPTKYSKHDHIMDSPCSVASSLERTDEIDRAMLTATNNGHSGKFSLPAYPVSITRTTSQCSSSSEYRPTDGHAAFFPIKTSCTELSWNCVKLQEHVSKEVTVKNVCDKHVSLSVTISGPGFQCSTIGKQRLEKFECRKFTIDFCPTVKGPAEGFLSFKLANTSQEFARDIHLFGYGGKSNVRVRGLETPPSGAKYLCMGTTRDLGHTMEQYIEIGNRGDIDAFILIAHETGTKPFNTNFSPSHLIITPQRHRVPGKRAGSVKISFMPTRAESRYICDQPQDVVTIAKVSVIYGDWATRDRLKQVTQKVAVANAVINMICQPFKDERASIKNYPEKFLDDALKAVQDCTDTFQHTEFLLTINKSPDETINLTQAIGEQSILFKSMLTDELRHYRTDSNEFPLEVTPAQISISMNETVDIKIRNSSNAVETFEIGHELRTFRFDPTEGQIRPGEEIVVSVQLAHGVPSMDSQFSIFVANGKLTIPVTVKSFFKQ